jgi:hypothetical protein
MALICDIAGNERGRRQGFGPENKGPGMGRAARRPIIVPGIDRGRTRKQIDHPHASENVLKEIIFIS